MLVFPVFKIGLLLFRTLAKPVANIVKREAKQHPRIRSIIISFAQRYHRLEVRLKRRNANIQVPDGTIPPLNDARAIELAANFIGESFLFTVAAAAVTFEAYRKKQEEAEKATMKEQKYRMLVERIEALEAHIELKKKEHEPQPQLEKNVSKEKEKMT